MHFCYTFCRSDFVNLILLKNITGNIVYLIQKIFVESLDQPIRSWVKVFRIIPEFRILRLTFHRKSASKR